METTAQREVDLHSKTVENLGEAGYEVTPQSINPNDESSLQKIKDELGNAAHYTGTTLEEGISGTSDTTRMRTIGNKTPLLIGRKRSLLQKAA